MSQKLYFRTTLLLTVKNVDTWIYRTDWGFSGWTFGCGQSTVGLQRNLISMCRMWLVGICWFGHIPSLNSLLYIFFLECVFQMVKLLLMLNNVGWIYRTASGFTLVDIWMWSIDCWTAKKLMLICGIESVEIVDLITSHLQILFPIFFWMCFSN